MIRLVNVRKSFGSQTVLSGLNLDIPDRAVYVVVGVSGAGKSCLLKHLIGLMRPDSGQVWIDDIEITLSLIHI